MSLYCARSSRSSRPSLRAAVEPRFPSSISLRPNPPLPGPGLSCHFTFARAPYWSPPARGHAPAGAGPKRVAGSRARHREADVGLALSRALGAGRASARLGGGARGRRAAAAAAARGGGGFTPGLGVRAAAGARAAPRGSKMSTEAQRVDDSPSTSGGSSDGDQRESVQQEPEREQVQPKKKEGKISSKTAAKLSTSAKR